jgi:hypothetical protein
VRITGKVVDSGQAIAVDLTDVAAQGCQGTIGLAAGASSTSSAVSGTANIVEVDSTVYMKLDESFFTSAGLPASDFSDVDGKYIKLTSKSDLASFAQLCDPSTLSGAFAKQDTGFVSRHGDDQRPARARVQAAQERLEWHRLRVGVRHPADRPHRRAGQRGIDRLLRLQRPRHHHRAVGQ